MSTSYVVVCDEYRKPCKTLDVAEHHLAAIEALGACQGDHHIEEVADV